MSKTIPVILILIIGISFNVYALTEDTHKAINDEIAKSKINGFSLDMYLVTQLGFSKGINEELNGIDAQGNSKNKEVYWWLGYGGEQEDRPGSFSDYFQNKPTRSANHFHNPLKHMSEAGLNELLGFYTGQSSVLWSQNPNQQIGGKWSWSDARNYFYSALTSTNKTQRDEYFAKTFRAVGQLMHIVQDASVPEHVRNDAHVLPAYEAYVEKMRPTLWNNWINNPIFDKSILNIPTVSLAPVPISRIIDTDLYNSQNPNITTSSKIGLAEYTNANFLSPDTMFTDDLSPDHRHYSPYPRAREASLWTDTSNILPRLYLKKTGEGEPVTHLAVVSLLYKYRDKYFPQYYLHIPVALDDECKKEYASKLIPRAVGYSAGLLNYFFRGEIDMISDNTAGTGYVIVNNTDENMSGTFELWYDSKNNTRVKLRSWSLSIDKKSSGNNKSTNISFTPPSDAKELCKFILVFKGQMGYEQNMVIGKVLNIGECVTGRYVKVSHNSGDKGFSITVYTESGKIFAPFPDISDYPIVFVSVRFNISNYDEFIVAIINGNYEFRKFKIDEPNKTIKYIGVVLSLPTHIKNIRYEKICEYTEDNSDFCRNYETGERGTYKIAFERSFREAGQITLSDFYYNGEVINPFGSYYDFNDQGVILGQYCNGRGFYYDFFVESYEWKFGLYYNGKLTSSIIDFCYDGAYSVSGDQCDALSSYNLCSGLKPGDIIEADIPIALFNETQYAYGHYISVYPNSWKLNKIFSPAPLTSNEGIKTMLRKDNGQSFYVLSEGMSVSYSYSSELGVINDRMLLSGDNQYDTSIGWSSDGNIIECFIDEEEQLICNKLNSVGGALFGSFQDLQYFDVSLKFP